MRHHDNTPRANHWDMDAFRINARAWQLILDKLKLLRSEGKTFTDIGKRLGVNRATVKRWHDEQRGGDRTAFKDLLHYLDRFGISLRDVFMIDEDYIPEPAEQIEEVMLTEVDVLVASTLRDLAKTLGKTPEWIAESVNDHMLASDVQAALKGKRALTVGQFLLICRAIGISPGRVMDRAADLAQMGIEGSAARRSA